MLQITHMKRLVVLEKEVGETPLGAIERWKAANLFYKNMPASYAGRLDPMASGKLLVLLGDECKRQREYIGLDKEYAVEILLDVGSDTGDVLGLGEYAHKETRLEEGEVQAALEDERGTHIRPYPIFSSKTVKGKPLFQYFYEGTISEIEIPTHEEKIYRIALSGVRDVSARDVKKRVQELLAKAPRTDEPSKQLGADFRIEAVRKSWEKVFEEAGDRHFRVLELRVVCASGTYMRTLAPRLGAALDTKALALSIHRTKIGKYVPVTRRIGFWKRVS